MIKIFPIILFTMITYSCSSQAEGWETWSDKKLKLSIRHPKEWDVNPNFPNMDLVIKSDYEGENDTFREFLTLKIEEVDKNTTIKDFVNKLSKEQVIKGINSDNVSKRYYMLHGEFKTFEIIESSNQAHLALILRYTVYIKKKKAYIFSFNAEKEKYEEYVRYADMMIESFTSK